MTERTDVRVEHGPRRCAFCHDDVLPEERVACASCLGAHHRACWEESGSCATCQSTEALVREQEGRIETLPTLVDHDPVGTLSELFPTLDYAQLECPIEHVTIFRKARSAIFSFAGEGFSDCWVIVGPEADPRPASAAAIEFIAKSTFQRPWHYLTREPVVNLIVIGEDPSGLPQPSKTRQFFSPLIYTVTRHDTKSGSTRVETTWTGSISAQRILVAVRYALETGALPEEGGLIAEGLRDTTAGKAAQWILWLVIGLFGLGLLIGAFGALIR